MSKKKDQIESLKAALTHHALAEDDLVNNAGALIDEGKYSSDLPAIQFGIDFLEKQIGLLTSQENICLAHYYIGVGYGEVFDKTIAKTDNAWLWEQEIVEKELTHLRIAFQNITPLVNEQISSYILINLGNKFSGLGRFLLALDFWNKARQIPINLGMAAINMGDSLMYYGLSYVNEPKYQIACIQLAHQFFTAGLKKRLFPGVAEEVKDRLHVIETKYKDVLDHRLVKADLVEEYDDQGYSGWCTENGLWLNPLANISPVLNCNKDDVLLGKADAGFSSFFQSIKEDFTYSRKLFYESKAAPGEYFEQRKKTCFKEVYSIFDKIAYLVGGIFKLERLDHARFNFSRMWYNKSEQPKGLVESLASSRNLMLRALYWVSRDIYLDETGFKNLIEPRAKEINMTRNYLEHRSFKFGERRIQSYSLEMSIEEFDENLLKLLKLARESLIYSAYVLQVSQTTVTGPTNSNHTNLKRI
jgi:hypothetical protein